MKNLVKRILSAVLVSGMLLSVTACGQPAQGGASADAGKSEEAFPTKQITIIMPWSLGGGPDTIARQVASYGEKYLGVPVIVENKNGGAGTIAMAAALQAADDGYSMVVANGPLFSLTPSFQNVNYTLDDITPLIGMREVEFVVLTNAEKSGIKTMDDLKAYAASGKTIKYATTGGPGNDSYTMISVLFKKLGLAAEAVPYDGGQDAINALVGGHVDVAIGSPPVYRDYVKNGQLACLGTFIPEGIDVDGIGHIPSFKEQGIDAEFIGMDYFAVRSSVDDAKKKVLTEFIQKVYADADFQKFMAEMGMKAWEGTEDEIITKIEEQKESMKDYIALLK
ncbi:tripartite tricarboxylate transporter substrate binding protein [Butyricicoccus sp. Marseille-Q5471]|uniref:tripartite tricarboxylate transporter substrate binding protein n=1 Tax=Butyricicoccus sp. Marseille-Q5471 TaxID=3039493 RepID=UPI0024BBFAFE|nr:tripartite tricarboxylate transporter substrate binding protein [Butyricicoccus sp. Marseille-Q5471]